MLAEGKHDYAYYDKEAEGYKANEPLYVADIKFYAWKHVTVDVKWVGRVDGGEGYMILHDSFTASRRLSGGTTYEFGPCLRGLPGRVHLDTREDIEIFGKVMLWADSIVTHLMKRSEEECALEKISSTRSDPGSTES